MRDTNITGALLVLAGAVLIAAGIIGDSVGDSGYGIAGYVFGGVIGGTGILMIVAGPIKRCWVALFFEANKNFPDS